MVKRIVDFFTSLKLTVVCLCLAVLLVFIGTLAQVDEGLYSAQSRFFRSLLIYWSPRAGWKIPVFPGGYLLGGVLLANLIAAHIRRFSLSRKKIGILLVHSGLILLLLGQFMTDLFSSESNMRLTEGQSKNYSESSLHNELAVIDTSNPDYDRVVAIPERALARKGEIRNPQWPFTVRVKDYFANSEPKLRAPMVDKGPPQATQGVVATRLQFLNAPTTTKMDDRNVPAAVIEVATAKGSLGTWLVSDWVTDESLANYLRRQWDQWLGGALDTPQTFTSEGKTYQLALRPVRHYKPFSLQLLKFSHDVYKGTDIPKNFASRVRLRRPDTGEDREMLIYMNNPLRYSGETFYQASFDEKDPRVTILQVVHNPSWLTPYLSCGLVGTGLIIQFLTHLIGFARKRTAPPTTPNRPGGKSREGKREPRPALLATASATATVATSMSTTAKRKTA
ncbi:MAG: cytochrome c biogenesis protein ResB [Limisphaerales bacterium]